MHVCVCVRETKRQIERCVVCVLFVCASERDRETERWCCVCASERDTEMVGGWVDGCGCAREMMYV